jgi:hypothetical protein
VRRKPRRRCAHAIAIVALAIGFVARNECAAKARATRINKSSTHPNSHRGHKPLWKNLEKSADSVFSPSLTHACIGVTMRSSVQMSCALQ